jgi:hypothetical protein
MMLRRRAPRRTTIAVLAAAAVLVGMRLASGPFQADVTSWNPTVRHILAITNCDAARSLGLAPARRGEPGYYRWHDADRDGIACETYDQSGQRSRGRFGRRIWRQ